MKISSLLAVIALGAVLLLSQNSFAGNWQSFDCGPGWGPTKSVAPTYPKRARELGIEGYIIMSFSVNPEGKVEDIAVVEAKPKRPFVRTATRAVSSLEFPPCLENGLATKLTNVSIKYDFNLER